MVDEKNGTVTKVFKAYLIVDYRSGSMRILQKKPRRKLKPFEIAIHVNLKLNIPDQTELVVEGEVDIPPHKVKEMSVHSI
jgi:hypothetical protein